jgi:GT2 family glycosyltransferase
VGKSSLAAVVVHHRSPDTVVATTEALLAEGVAPDRLILVDNSEDDRILDRLRKQLEVKARVVSVPNGGYGQAANAGVKLALELHSTPERILISTHEARPRKGTVEALERALDDDPTLGAVGPVLVSDVHGREERVTAGGRLTTLLNIPMPNKTDLRHIPAGRVVRCDWLDGSFVLYRCAPLVAAPFREEFFLYYEETETHARMTEQGWRIGCATDALVRERSAGIPPRLRGRNLQWFQQLHGNRFQRLAVVPTVVAKSAARSALRKGTSGETRMLAVGWSEAVRRPLRKHAGGWDQT